MIVADALMDDDPIAWQVIVAPLTERETSARVRLVLSSLTVILPIGAHDITKAFNDEFKITSSL